MFPLYRQHDKDCIYFILCDFYSLSIVEMCVLVERARSAECGALCVLCVCVCSEAMDASGEPSPYLKKIADILQSFYAAEILDILRATDDHLHFGLTVQ